MTDKKTFGLFIKQKRTEKNYSQKDLAEILFVTESAISKWERGISYPDITLISDICRALDISEHELITASKDIDARRIDREARNFRTIRGAWFWIPTVLYSVALLICFICNLAVDHTLSWFFVVLSALVCGYSFVPTFTSFFKSNKLLVFSVTSFSSICLLLSVCAKYTNTMFWLLTSCIGVLMGYTLLFFPILLSKSKIKRFRFVILFALLFLLTNLLLQSIYVWQPFMLVSATKITAYGFVPVFFCSIICMFNFDSYIKLGSCMLLSTLMCYFSGYIVNCLFGLSENYYKIDFYDWQQCASANILFIVLLSLFLVSVAFICIGFFRIRKLNSNK